MDIKDWDGEHWTVVKYSIATCPHCLPGETQRRFNEQPSQSERNKDQQLRIQDGSNCVVQYKFICRKDSTGKDERTIFECGYHGPRERWVLLRRGKAKRRKEVEKLLWIEQMRDSVPPRLETQVMLMSKDHPYIIEKLEDGTVLNQYIKRRRDGVKSSRVDWVNHPTKILCGENRGKDAVDLD